MGFTLVAVDDFSSSKRIQLDRKVMSPQFSIAPPVKSSIAIKSHFGRG